MFASVLIANRGEIAVRIARTARRLGMRTIAVYSDADAGALHVRACDEARHIGPAAARESYLDIARLVEAARASGAHCVHPGYGFLAENAQFAEALADAGIAFIGPPPAAIRAMGLKDRAKDMMLRAGVPVVPGYHGPNQDAEFLREAARAIGFPVLIKAVAGGGGKGLRPAHDADGFLEALQSARREALSAFGDERVLIEKFVSAPRHIEFQIFADRSGNILHLNERDCSLQRRHQKVIEEAPACGMTPELRHVMGGAAVAAARAVGYEGAGTVEFIADGAGGLRPDGFWFMEMNTRLQVEHPVTEAVTGLDLVEWQFRVAFGATLALAQRDVTIDGHAIEARIYAEDPQRGFLPSAGTLLALEWSRGDGIRVDAGVEAGDAIVPHYDAMIAKLIAHAPTRAAALDRLAEALERSVVLGPRNNVAFLAALCRDGEVRGGKTDTGLIARRLDAFNARAGAPDLAAAAAGAARLLDGEGKPVAATAGAAVILRSPWDARDGFQLGGERSLALPIRVDGRPMIARVTFAATGPCVTVDGIAAGADVTCARTSQGMHVARHGRQTVVRLQTYAHADGDAGDSSGRVAAPMHGRVLAVLVEPGAEVKRGQRLALMEAMKMEHTLAAPYDGVIAEVMAKAGQQVAEGATILRVEPHAISARQ